MSSDYETGTGGHAVALQVRELADRVWTEWCATLSPQTKATLSHNDIARLHTEIADQTADVIGGLFFDQFGDNAENRRTAAVVAASAALHQDEDA